MRKNKNAFALFVILCIISLVGIATASVMAFSSYQYKEVCRTKNNLISMGIAEAGANQAIALLKEDFSNKNNSDLFLKTSFNNGSFDVTVTSVGNNKAQILCEGVYGSSTSIVICDTEDFSYQTPNTDSSSPYYYTIFSNGGMIFNGSGNLQGNIRCNQNITCNGTFYWGTDVKNCNVYCSQTFTGHGNDSTLYGTIYSKNVIAPNQINRVIQTINMIDIPQLDLVYYYNIAVKNNQVFSGGTLNGNIGTIAGGVRWYNGDITINSGVSYSGCIIATGNITFKGGCVQTKIGTYPALVSRDGSISLSGTRSMQGLIWSKGDYTCNGSGELNGTVICGGVATFNGSYGLHAYAASVPENEGSKDDSGASVGVTAWQK